MACLLLLAGTDRRRQTASKMAPVGDSSVLRKQMGFICLMACVVAIRRREKRRMEESNWRMGRPWVRPWMERRVGQGAFTLVGELRVEDRCSFRNYRMSDALFDELCGLVATAIKRNDTNMRLAISVISYIIFCCYIIACSSTFKSPCCDFILIKQY